MSLLNSFLNYLKGTSPTDDVQVMVVVPPDGGYSWFIVAASFYVNFVVDGCLFSYGVTMPALQETLNASITKVSMISSIYMGTYYFSGPLTAACLNHFGFRLTSLIGSILLLVGFTASAYTSNYIVFLVLYSIFGGFGSGMLYTTSIVIVSYHFERYRALASGMSTCGSAFGSVVLAILLEYVVQNYGLKETMILQGILASSTILCAMIYRPPKRTPVNIDDIGDELIGIMDDKPKKKGDKDVQSRLRKSVYGSNLDEKALRTAISMTNFGPSRRMRNAISSSEHNVRSVKNFENEERKWYQCCKCCYKSSKKAALIRFASQRSVIHTRPLDRKDIFAGMSMADFSEMRPASMGSIAPAKQTTSTGGCCREFINPDLFKSTPYIFAVLALFAYTLALSTPYLFIVSDAIQKGMPSKLAHYLLPAIGVGNIFGRIMAGLVSFLPKFNTRHVVSVTLTLVGIIIIIHTFVETDIAAFHFATAISIGLLIAFSPTLRPISYVFYLGMDLLTSAFGVGLMIAGVAALTGAPLAGYLKTVTGSFESSFIFCGATFIMSAIFQIVAEMIYQRSLRKSDTVV